MWLCCWLPFKSHNKTRGYQPKQRQPGKERFPVGFHLKAKKGGTNSQKATSATIYVHQSPFRGFQQKTKKHRRGQITSPPTPALMKSFLYRNVLAVWNKKHTGGLTLKKTTSATIYVHQSPFRGFQQLKNQKRSPPTPALMKSFLYRNVLAVWGKKHRGFTNSQENDQCHDLCPPITLVPRSMSTNHLSEKRFMSTDFCPPI